MTIPTNLRAPILAVEFDDSRAFLGPTTLAYKALLVGGRTAGGSVAEKVIKRVTSADQVSDYFGENSQLREIAEKWFSNNKITETYAVALDDDVAGVPATGTITFTGTATADGTVYAYVGGRRITAAVSSGDSATDVGDALDAACDADPYLLATGVNAGGVVTFTANNDGEPGNDIDLRLNYNEGEELPAGITAAVVGMASGATNPDLQDVIDILGDEWYQIFVAPYVDATNLTAIETELADRFGALRMIDGVYFSAKSDTLANLATFGNGRNSPHVSVSAATDVISHPMALAAAIAGRVAGEGSIDPARPFQTLELIGILPVPVVDRFTYVERNSLLFDGIATVNVDSAGKVRIERVITMYQKNDAQAASIAYLDVNTMLSLMYIRYDFRTTILAKYPRAKLADDATRIQAGQSVMTPKVGKAEAIAKFRQWEALGIVENFDQFKADLVCERSSTDPNRLEWTIPPDLVNQFRVGGATIQFLLQSPSI